eukprot:tig00000074_g1198.t1
MSTVVLQVGQCGNQLGGEWWRLVQADASASRSFIDSDGKARCVLIDSEPKVIQGLLKGPGGDLFRPGNVAYEQSGRGNNWALGYYKSGYWEPSAGAGAGGGNVDEEERNGRSLVGRAMAALRREAERCDWYQGCVLLHSIGGGTGAGVGSRLVEAVREEYPPNYITAVSVAPFLQGETPTQSYNALLTIAWLQRHADAVLLFPNEDAQRVLARREAGPQGGGGAWGGARVSTRDLNRHVAGCLAGILYPSRQGPGGPWRPYDAGDLVATLCPLPAAKFLEARASGPRPLAALDELLVGHAGYERGGSGPPLVSLSTQLLVRGDAALYRSLLPLAAGPGLAPGHSRHRPPDAAGTGPRARLLHAYPSVPWNPFPFDVRFSEASAPAPSKSAAPSKRAADAPPPPPVVTAVSNRSGVAGLLEHFLSRARAMFDARAYLHWYGRYGCGAEEMEAAFEEAATAAAAYRALVA